MFGQMYARSRYHAVRVVVAFAISCGVVGLLSPPLAADTLKVGGTGTALVAFDRLAAAFNASQTAHTVMVLRPSVGSSGAILGVIRGELALGVSARSLKDGEELKGITADELARSPFVLATARKSPGSFTVPELVEIYAGRTQRWPDGQRLRLVMRPSNDSDISQLRAISPELRQAVDGALERPGMVIATTDQEAADLIEQTPGALGTTILALIHSEQRSLFPLAIDGVTPDLPAAMAGRYPHIRKFFVVTREPPDAGTAAFLAFLNTAQARQILQESGYWVTLNRKP